MSMTGRVARVDLSNGCTLIEPDDGSPTVMFPSDDADGEWSELKPGAVVKFSTLPGTCGPSVYNLTVLLENQDESSLSCRMGAAESQVHYRISRRRTRINVVRSRDYSHEITSLLNSLVPDMSAAQLSYVRDKLTADAAKRGWIR
jgi:cold shock CspA family protein